MRSLAGFTVVVASERRRHHLAALLENEQARTVNVQAVRAVAQPVAADVAAATRECVASPVHEVIVSSAFGLRAWLRVVRDTGQLDAVIARFAEARLLAQDAHAADTLRELGLSQIWATASATTEDLFRYLLAQPMAGRRVVAQIESEHHRELCAALRARGATVVEVLTSQFLPPMRTDVLRRLCGLIVRRQVDAVALTGEAATRNLLRQAEVDGVLDAVLNTLSDSVVTACLGPLAAAPLRERGVVAQVAPTPELADLVADLGRKLPAEALSLEVAGCRVQIRSQSIAVDGRVVPVQPGPVAVLRTLARWPGRVLSAAEIRGDSPAWTDVDDHAVEMAVSRLRRAFEGTALAGVDPVQTVIRRGYRLVA